MTRSGRLKRLLSPRKVAWFGGGGIGSAITYMRENGYDGDAIAVNPKRSEIAGLSCVPSVEALPWVPDLAVLVIPKDAVVQTTDALSELGCGGAICITSGFSESADGATRQAALVEAADDMPVIGPNCPGIANFLDGSAFMMDHFGQHAHARGVAVVSNGGAYLSDLGCADRSQPIAYLIGLGNQAIIGIADMMDVVLDDPRVTVINVYFEGIADVAALSHAAAKAARKGIPVIAIKGGKSATGKRAAQSHTASLAGDAAIASALFRRFGWIEVSTATEAIETIKMLSYTTLPRGVKTGFVTSSGSYAVLGGDVAEALGLRMVSPSKDVAHQVDSALPPYVRSANPLDISDAHGWEHARQRSIYEAFARDDYDLFVQVMCYPPKAGWDMSTWEVTTAALAEAKGERPAAFVNTLAEALPHAVRERMISSGMAPLQGLEDGLRAVANAARYGATLDAVDPASILLDEPGEASDVRGNTLSEPDAKDRLEKAGLDVPQRCVVNGPDNLPCVLGPCVLKAVVPGLLHKTDVGAVGLGLEPDDLPGALRAMKARLDTQGLTAESFLIEKMVLGQVGELLVGIRRVPEIGPCLTLAIGGAAVELLQDTVTMILPVPRHDIMEAINRLKLAPLLTGYRGRAAADFDIMLDAIEALCTFVINAPDIAELEINPLLLTPSRAVIADAVLTMKG